MTKRILLAVVCILALPILFAVSNKSISPNSVPFATVALAGHTGSGGWCECGAPGCICEPGEGGNLVYRDQTADSSKSQSPSPAENPASSDVDFGSAALLAGFALFMWMRLLRL